MADAILAAWLADEDAGEKWGRLQDDIDPPVDRLAVARRRRWLARRRAGR